MHKYPSTYWGIILLSSGILVQFLGYASGLRIGFMASEPNFGSFSAFILVNLIALASRSYLKAYIQLLPLLCITLYLSLSRALLVGIIIAPIAYIFLNPFFFSLAKQKIILIFTAITCTVYSFNSEFFAEYFSITKQSGYKQDWTRLYSIIDSSFMERLHLSQSWSNEILSSTLHLLFGLSSPQASRLNSSLMEPHNSYISMTSNYGLLVLISFLALLIVRLPGFISFTAIIYGLFLHNIFVLPLLFVVLFFPSSVVRSKPQRIASG